MVAAVVVVLVASVGRSVALVPDVRKLGHRGGLPAVEEVEEVVVDRLAVVSGAACVDADRPSDLRLVCGHDVDQVSEALRVVVSAVQSLESDVDVDSASP